MAEQSEHPILIAVATTIADGLPVDWENLIDGHPEIAEDLRTLRLLSKVPEARIPGKDGKQKTEDESPERGDRDA